METTTINDLLDDLLSTSESFFGREGRDNMYETFFGRIPDGYGDLHLPPHLQPHPLQEYLDQGFSAMPRSYDQVPLYRYRHRPAPQPRNQGRSSTRLTVLGFAFHQPASSGIQDQREILGRNALDDEPTSSTGERTSSRFVHSPLESFDFGEDDRNGSSSRNGDGTGYAETILEVEEVDDNDGGNDNINGYVDEARQRPDIGMSTHGGNEANAYVTDTILDDLEVHATALASRNPENIPTFARDNQEYWNAQWREFYQRERQIAQNEAYLRTFRLDLEAERRRLRQLRRDWLRRERRVDPLHPSARRGQHNLPSRSMRRSHRHQDRGNGFERRSGGRGVVRPVVDEDQQVLDTIARLTEDLIVQENNQRFHESNQRDDDAFDHLDRLTGGFF